MTLNHYFNKMLLIFTSVLLIAMALTSVLLINNRLNNFLSREHNIKVEKIKNLVEDIMLLNNKKTFDKRVDILESAIRGTGYSLSLKDTNDKLIFTVGGLHNRENNRKMKNKKSETYAINKNGDTVAYLTIYYMRSFNASNAAIAFKTRIQIILLSVMIIGVIGIFIISKCMSNKIIKPIYLASEKSTAVAKGQLIDLPNQMNSGIKELDDLNFSIDTMAQSLKVQNKLRIRLVEQMGHEIKTPLAIVKGQLEAVKDGVMDWNQERLNIIHSEVTALGSLVEGLEDLQALTNSYKNTKIESIDLTAFLHVLISKVLYSYQKRSLILEHEIEEALNIKSDKVKLKSVLMNLLVNAQKYSPENTVVYLIAKQEENNIIIEVINTKYQDIKINEKKLGTAGYRGQLKNIEGRGMGLFIIKEMTRHIDADVVFRVSPTTFSAKVILK